MKQSRKALAHMFGAPVASDPPDRQSQRALAQKILTRLERGETPVSIAIELSILPSEFDRVHQWYEKQKHSGKIVFAQETLDDIAAEIDAVMATRMPRITNDASLRSVLGKLLERLGRVQAIKCRSCGTGKPSICAECARVRAERAMPKVVLPLGTKEGSDG